jgi:hypothetical protein
LRSAVSNDAGTILGNPIDFPPLVSSNEAYLSILRKLSVWEGIDLLLFQVPLRGIMVSLSLACAIFDAQLDNIIKVCTKSSKPMAVIVHYLASGESWHAVSNYQRKCYEAGLPVYHSIASATKAIDRLLHYHEKRLAGAREGY